MSAWRQARRASYIVPFPDCVEEAGATVDRLWRWRRGESDLADAAVRRTVIEEAAVARCLHARCRKRRTVKSPTNRSRAR